MAPRAHPKPSVAICAPSHGAPWREHERALTHLRMAHPEWQLLALDDFALIDLARCILAETALAEGVDVALFLDNDMNFKVSVCEELVREAYARQQIVGALYLGKEFGGRVRANFLPGTEEIPCFEAGRVMEVLDIGFGCVAVPTPVFTGIAKKLAMKRVRVKDHLFYPWFCADLAADEFLSEDYAFTERARKAGYKVLADTRQRVGHLGYYEFGLEDCNVMPPPRFSSMILKG